MMLGSQFKAFRNHWCATGHRCTVWFFLIVTAIVLASPGWFSYWVSPWQPAFGSIQEGMSTCQVQQIMGPPTVCERVDNPPYASGTTAVRWTYRSPLRMVSYSVCFDRHEQVCANSMVR